MTQQQLLPLIVQNAVKEKLLLALFLAFRHNDEVFQEVAGHRYLQFGVRWLDTNPYAHNSSHLLALFGLAYEYIPAEISEPLYATVYIPTTHVIQPGTPSSL